MCGIYMAIDKSAYRASRLELLLPAVDAVGHLVFAVERLVGQLVLAARAHETLRVPSLIQGV